MRNVYGGLLDGALAEESSEPFGWIDANGRVYPEPGSGRLAYRYVLGGWAFAGHGAQRGSCGGCLLAPDPQSGGPLASCPLCGASQEAFGRADQQSGT
jgi:hypothetical protein